VRRKVPNGVGLLLEGIEGKWKKRRRKKEEMEDKKSGILVETEKEDEEEDFGPWSHWSR
jgi:hypothetical protein